MDSTAWSHNDMINYVQIRTKDPSHKSLNALDRYPTMRHFVTEMCTHVHICVTKWCIVGYGTDELWDLFS